MIALVSNLIIVVICFGPGLDSSSYLSPSVVCFRNPNLLLSPPPPSTTTFWFTWPIIKFILVHEQVKSFQQTNLNVDDDEDNNTRRGSCSGTDEKDEEEEEGQEVAEVTAIGFTFPRDIEINVQVVIILRNLQLISQSNFNPVMKLYHHQYDKTNSIMNPLCTPPISLRRRRRSGRSIGAEGIAPGYT